MWIRQACKRSADRKPLGLSTALLTLRSMTFNSDCWLTRCETVALQLFGLLPYQNYDINGLTSSHWQLSAIGEMGCWYPVHFAAVHVHAMTKVIVGQVIFVDICCLAFSAANATPQRPCPARSTVLRTTLGCGIKYDADIVAGMTHRFEPRGTTFFLMAWRRGGVAGVAAFPLPSRWGVIYLMHVEGSIQAAMMGLCLAFGRSLHFRSGSLVFRCLGHINPVLDQCCHCLHKAFSVTKQIAAVLVLPGNKQPLGL